MFFYLSFLRPPPLQAAPYAAIPITPQVANDLRTEPFPGAQDIFYSWSPWLGDKSNALPLISTPQKLTTWRTSSAYKEVSVHPPVGVRDGLSYRLVLTTHNQGHPHGINLAGTALGERPFPVVSAPILFSARNLRGKVSGKQEQVERVYRIVTPSQDQAFLTVTEQTSFDLDKKVWDSGVGLSSWLDGLIGRSIESMNTAEKELQDLLLSCNPCDVIELGAGTGIVSLTLGVLRSVLNLSGGNILATDLASAMPLLEHNITANDSLFRPFGRPQALVLDWDEDLPAEVLSIGGFSLIIMADVTYNTASFPALVRTLAGLVHLGPRPPLVLLGYKERDSAERTLWDMMSDVGFLFERVGERIGAGDQPVEVWIGRVTN